MRLPERVRFSLCMEIESERQSARKRKEDVGNV